MEETSVPQTPPEQSKKPPPPKWVKWVGLIVPMAAMFLGYWLGGLLDTDRIWRFGGMYVGVTASIIPLLFIAERFPDAFPPDPNQQPFDWMD